MQHNELTLIKDIPGTKPTRERAGLMPNFLKINYDSDKRIFGLDMLRAAAILIVLLVHSEFIIKQNFPKYYHFKYVDGVDLFFVLSGFLIGSILIKSFEINGLTRYSILNFWKRRWFRTLPNYFLVLILSLVFIYLTTGNSGDYSAKYLLFSQNIFNSHPDFFPIAWSLAVEEWFYLLFPVSVAILRRLLPAWSIKRIIFLSILIFLLAPLLYRLKKGLFFSREAPEYELWDSLFRKTVVTRLDTIVFGVLGAYFNYYYSALFNRYKVVKFLLGIGIIYISKPLFMAGLPGYTIFFDVVALGILLLIPLLNSLHTAPKFISVPITYISIISYSIYLIHYPLILYPIINLKPYSNMLTVVYAVLYFSLTIMLSVVLYKYFENPVMRLREKEYKF
ncbi:MAG: acyltransferase [Ferruginibacter sp.]